MQKISVADAQHYLAYYSNGVWSAKSSDNDRVRIIAPGHDSEVDEDEVTNVKLTAYFYSWRIGRQD